MPWKLPPPRFGLRTLLVVVFICAVGLALYTSPGRWRTYRNQQARQRIDPYELSIAGDGKPTSVPPELVAILGDSRLKHWHQTQRVVLLAENQLLTCGVDDLIRIWDAKTGRQLHRFDGSNATASGDRKLAFLAAPDGTVVCWDVAAKRIVHTLRRSPPTLEQSADNPPFHVFMAANRDGSVLVVEHLWVDSRAITVWDVLNEQPRFAFQLADRGRSGLAVSRDGKTFTWVKDNQIQVTDAASGKVLRTIGPTLVGNSRCHIGEAVLAINERSLFVGSSAHFVVVFDWVSGEEIQRIGQFDHGVYQFALDQHEHAGVFAGQPKLMAWRKFNSDWRHWGEESVALDSYRHVDWYGDRIVGSHGHEISLLRSRPSVSTQRLQGGPTSTIRCLAFHPDGDRLLTGDSTGEVAIWEVGSWRKMQGWPAHRNSVEAILISRDGTKGITSAHDEAVVVWDASTMQEICSLPTHGGRRFVGVSPDGAELAMEARAPGGASQVEIVSASSGGRVRALGPISESLECDPNWSPDGSRLVLEDGDALVIFNVAAQKPIGRFAKVIHGNHPLSAVWFSDNKRLVTAGWGQDEVHVLEVGKAKPVATLNTGGGTLQCIALHPSQQFIAVCGRECPVQIWDLPTAKLVKSWQIGPPKGIVSQVEFSPDGHYLATVNGNGTAYVLSLDGVLAE